MSIMLEGLSDSFLLPRTKPCFPAILLQPRSNKTTGLEWNVLNLPRA